MTPPPHPRRLTRTWLILMALTVASMAAGRVTAAEASLGLAGIGLVLGVTLLKARWVVMDYLNLRHVAGSWRALMGLYLVIVAAAILAAYAVAAWR